MRLLSGRWRNSLGQFFDFIKVLLARWNRDKVSTYAASLAYYAIFSLAPLIIICTALIGLTFGKNIAETRIIEMASSFIGNEGAQQIHTMILNSTIPIKGTTAGIISFIILFIGASGIFTQIQVGLNAILPREAKKKRPKLIKYLMDRFFSFTLVLGVAFLLLVSLIFSVILSFLSNYTIPIFSMGIATTWCLDFIVSFIGITFLFGLLYKILPEIKLKWSEVIFGSMIAAFLFILGKLMLSLYLGTKHVSNAFGPAGSLVIILIWLYYSALILFLGAEVITIKKMKKIIKRNLTHEQR